MSEYNEGDLVEAANGERVARSRLVTSRYPSNTGETGLYLDGFSNLPYANSDEGGRFGWTFTVVEKAKPPLPSEPGIYVDKYGRDAWLIATANSRIVCVANRSSDPDKYAPFTRLEPVAETAKKMRDRILEDFKRDTNRSYSEDVAFVATEFGVIS